MIQTVWHPAGSALLPSIRCGLEAAAAAQNSPVCQQQVVAMAQVGWEGGQAKLVYCMILSLSRASTHDVLVQNPTQTPRHTPAHVLSTLRRDQSAAAQIGKHLGAKK